MAFLLLHAITVFSSFSIILGDILQKTAAAAVDHLVTDGSQFVKRIVHGEKLSDNPGYFLFTAPYKLCEGDCREFENNFAMAFPIYVGKKGKEKYKELYGRDFKIIHATKINAPFKKRPTKKQFTLCQNEMRKQTTIMTTEPEPTLTDALTTVKTTTVSDMETTLTDTPTIPKTESTATETPIIDITTETPTSLETESTTEEPTSFEFFTTETSVFETYEPITDTITNLPDVTEAVLPTTDTSDETMYTTKTETPKVTDTEVTETEDITFESYTDTADSKSKEKDTTLVTNANGVSCPPRICRKKTKATPNIITFVTPDLRNALWNSDYSDLGDSFSDY